MIYSKAEYGKMCHYFVNKACNRNNIIHFLIPLHGLYIVQDQCGGEWNTELNDFESVNIICGTPCRIHDLQPNDPIVWEPIC